MLNKSKFKYIQSLAQKKLRDELNMFVAEGTKIVNELLQTGASIVEVFALEEWISENPGLIPDITVTEITEKELDRLSQLSTPNQVVAVLRKFPSHRATAPKDEWVLALDTVQDPGNLGTIIRTADWFGVKNIACSPECADMYNSKVVQSTMGSIARINVFYTDLENWLAGLQDTRIYAATLEGRNINSIQELQKGVLVIGNESKGIRENILKYAQARLTIPRIGKAESLNAAVATGILLSHLRRER